MNEKFILCDLKQYVKADKTIVYYIVVYSTLTENSEKIFINQQDFEYLQKVKQNVNINEYLSRYYNTYRKTFAIKFTRKV